MIARHKAAVGDDGYGKIPEPGFRQLGEAIERQHLVPF